MNKGYRIMVVIETYEDMKNLENQDAEPVSTITGYAVTKSYTTALNKMSEALSQFSEDPLYGADWER